MPTYYADNYEAITGEPVPADAIPAVMKNTPPVEAPVKESFVEKVAKATKKVVTPETKAVETA